MSERRNWLWYWEIASEKFAKCQVNVKPLNRSPVCSDTDAMKKSGTRKNTTMPGVQRDAHVVVPVDRALLRKHELHLGEPVSPRGLGEGGEVDVAGPGLRDEGVAVLERVDVGLVVEGADDAGVARLRHGVGRL